ncbi:MAG: PEP-CTERM sorting domain-containing protein, partial [Gammaproteobacteria bacterium]|nr:PEP-CTERM sorting domain-containing protein [Gammaproteobacteria bacterium]
RTFYFPMNEIWPLDKQTGAGAAWAVHSGDVAVVPAPAAVWLLGSALGFALSVTRRKRGLRSP